MKTTDQELEIIAQKSARVNLNDFKAAYRQAETDTLNKVRSKMEKIKADAEAGGFTISVLAYGQMISDLFDHNS
jgi:hypothetical protein